MNWNKAGLWLSAIFMQANVMYPGLTAEDIVGALRDGTFWMKAGTVVVSTIMVRAAVLVRTKKKAL